MDLDEAVKKLSPRRGGAREGAGRPKSVGKRHDPPHRARRELASKHPVHVVLRTCSYVPRLRQGRVYRATRRVLVRYLGRDDFRIVHVSIQHNHFHFIVEARDNSGWCGDGFDSSPRFSIPPGYEQLPVSPPSTALLRHDWTRHGAIDLFETPGPLR